MNAPQRNGLGMSPGCWHAEVDVAACEVRLVVKFDPQQMAVARQRLLTEQKFPLFVEELGLNYLVMSRDYGAGRV